MNNSVKIVEKREKEASSKFFKNRTCEYYPCHETEREDFNCLFCFCPMYYAICLGEPKYIDLNGALIKDCSGCDYPHEPENYESILEYLTLVMKGEC
jgi:Zn-finger protein